MQGSGRETAHRFFLNHEMTGAGANNRGPCRERFSSKEPAGAGRDRGVQTLPTREGQYLVPNPDREGECRCAL